MARRTSPTGRLLSVSNQEIDRRTRADQSLQAIEPRDPLKAGVAQASRSSRIELILLPGDAAEAAIGFGVHAAGS